MRYYVYILECCDKTLYTGYTNNLEKRVNAHNLKKGAKYTKSRVPVKLVYFEEYDNLSEALKREIEIKKLKKIEKLNLIEKRDSN